MKLTIEDIAKYLPYNVSFMLGGVSTELSSLDKNGNDPPIAWSINKNRTPSLLIKEVKFILRPFSQLIKTIIHKGER